MSERITRASVFNFWALLPTRFRPALGVIGEALARRYLRKAGYSILAANWSCPEGEIDIVATRGSTLIFVEVKSCGKVPTKLQLRDHARRRELGFEVVVIDSIDAINMFIGEYLNGDLEGR